MNRRIGNLIGLMAVAVFAGGSLVMAADQKDKPPMHMHKAEMDHSKSDPELSAAYKSEAMQLREKAESHRKLAELYKTRTPAKGGGNYGTVAKHCENLAKIYSDAAKEADAISSELGKK